MAEARTNFDIEAAFAALEQDASPAAKEFAQSCGAFFRGIVSYAMSHEKAEAGKRAGADAIEVLRQNLTEKYEAFEAIERSAGRGIDPAFTNIYADLFHFSNFVQRRHLEAEARVTINALRARLA